MIPQFVLTTKLDRRANDEMLEPTRKLTWALIAENREIGALMRPVHRGEFAEMSLGKEPFAFIVARIRRLPPRDAESGEGYDVKASVIEADIHLAMDAFGVNSVDTAMMLDELIESKRLDVVFSDRYSMYVNEGDFETLSGSAFATPPRQVKGEMRPS